MAIEICLLHSSGYTDSKYIWVCGSRSIPFSGKSTIFDFFLMQKGVCSYRHAHDIPPVALIVNTYIYIYIWVRGSNFNCSSVNRGYTD